MHSIPVMIFSSLHPRPKTEHNYISIREIRDFAGVICQNKKTYSGPNIDYIKNLEKNIHRLSYSLRAAQSSSIEIKDSYDFYTLALKELYKSNGQDAFFYYDRANYDLIEAINTLSGTLMAIR